MARYAMRSTNGNEMLVRASGRWSRKSQSFYEYVGDLGNNISDEELVGLKGIYEFKGTILGADL
jgi:hypothetical protein